MSKETRAAEDFTQVIMDAVATFIGRGSDAAKAAEGFEIEVKEHVISAMQFAADTVHIGTIDRIKFLCGNKLARYMISDDKSTSFTNEFAGETACLAAMATVMINRPYWGESEHYDEEHEEFRKAAECMDDPIRRSLDKLLELNKSQGTLDGNIGEADGPRGDAINEAFAETLANMRRAN